MIDLYKILSISRDSTEDLILEALAKYIRSNGDKKTVLAVKSWLLNDDIKIKYDLKLNQEHPEVRKPKKEIQAQKKESSTYGWNVTAENDEFTGKVEAKYSLRSKEVYKNKAKDVFVTMHLKQSDIEKGFIHPTFSIDSEWFSGYVGEVKLKIKIGDTIFPAMGVFYESGRSYSKYFWLAFDGSVELPKEFKSTSQLSDYEYFRRKFHEILTDVFLRSDSLIFEVRLKVLGSKKFSFNLIGIDNFKEACLRARVK